MNLTRTNWPLAWTPSADAVNGNPEGLLRADNLRVDKTGCISLIDGARQIGTYPDFISAIFTRVIAGTEHVWTATGFPPNAITSNFGVGPGTSLVLQDAPTDRCGFGDGLGNIYAVAGNLRTKDPIRSAPLQLGLLTPNAPTYVYNGQASLSLPAPTNPLEGVPTEDGGSTIQLDPASLWGTLTTAVDSAFSIDTTIIGGSTVQASDPNDDLIQFAFSCDQGSSQIATIEIDLILDGDPTDPNTYNNYYSFTFPAGVNQIPGGAEIQAVLSARRGDFLRYGSDGTKDWKQVIGIRIHVEGFSQSICTFSDIRVSGGANGGVNGVYTYICQAVADNGVYIAKSPVSVPTANITVVNGSVTLTATGDANAKSFRFYRKSVTDLGIDPNTGFSLNTSSLPQYYFVGEAKPGIAFRDALSDSAVLQLNADGSLLPNLFLKTLAIKDPANALADSLYGIEGLYNERMLYLSGSFLYLSDRLNPDAVDTRFTLRPSGDPEEKNLWIKKLTNNVLILATTKTLYEISGTLLENPDGTIDSNIINLGESHPPLSVDVCSYNNGLFYIASDGLRVTRGSNSTNVSPQLRYFFESGMLDRTNPMRHGVPAVAIYNNINVDYSIAAAHGKIYFICPMMDGTRRLFYYDNVADTLNLMYTDPIKLHSTEADELLASYGGSGGNGLFALDCDPGKGFNGSSGFPITFRTVFDSNNQPRNRKDTFTLKLVFDSGNKPINVSIQQDGIGVTESDENNYFSLGQYTGNGQTTVLIDISGYTLGFRYSIQITDINGLFTFKLYELTIEYEARPEQLNYLRIPANNLGSISRKRITAYGFVVDTLGNTINFTPFLDHAGVASSSVQTLEKSTYVHYFYSNLTAVDVGGILSGGPFEFYGVNLDECISEKLPPPVKFLVIPHNNYGTPNRKRHTSYKFQIDTRGKKVQFTPIIDSISYTPIVYTTYSKLTVEYFFTETDGDVIGVDIGGILQSLENTPFEFYGAISPQKVETLPDRLQFYRIPNTNMGVAARKRIRTLPMVIDTYGKDVSYIPIIDGKTYPEYTSTFNTKGKITVFHYFSADVFGVDFGGILQGDFPFEFYDMEKPENVEVLPIAKTFDMLGPMRFDKIGKLFGFRARLISTGTTTSIPYAIYGSSSAVVPSLQNPIFTGSIPVMVNVDDVYEVQLPKNVNTTMFRLTFGPVADPFHRYDVLVKVQTSGMESESKWQIIR